ncbi:MAG: hypothetical protein ACI4TZ_03135 [Christensenellales bacterium]
MNKDKKYLNKTAELVSDAKAENKLGVMYLNSKANKKVYITNVDVKNVEKEICYVKTNVCKFCAEIFDYYVSLANDKNDKFYKNAADFYNYAIKNNLDAKEIYTTTKKITDLEKDLTSAYTNTADCDFDMSLSN